MMIQRGAVAPHQWEGNDDTEERSPHISGKVMMIQRSGRPASEGRL